MSSEGAAHRAVTPTNWLEGARSYASLLRRFYMSAHRPLSPEQKHKVEHAQLRDLTRRSGYWLIIVVLAAALIVSFAEKPSYPELYSWLAVLISAAIIPYMFLVPITLRLRSGTPPSVVRWWLAVWAIWLSAVSLIWVSGNWVMWLMPASYVRQMMQDHPEQLNRFILDRQLFIYLTLIGQLFTLIFLSPNRVILLLILSVGVAAPAVISVEQIIRTDDTRLSWVNADIFFYGQIGVYLIVGALFSGVQKHLYGREVLLKEERARASAEQRRANNFVETVSHDLRGPLSVMSTALETLRLRARSQPTLLPLVDAVRQQNRELGKLIEACFDLARLSSGTWKLEVREVVLAQVIDGVVRTGSALASQAGLEFICQPCPPFIVRTDPAALTMILGNLIGNAIKYTPAMKGDDPGRVTIEFAVAADEKSICISVVDNGKGIPENKREEIFKEYVQLDNPEREPTKGFGLGLSIVKGLSNLLGNNPKVDSTEGVGSRFWITVPVASREAKPWVPDDDQQTVHENLTDMVVMYVEDLQPQREEMTQYLTQLGATVIAGASADEVIAKSRESNPPSSPHFLLCDYRLPHGDGIDAIAAIRMQLKWPIPAAIVTAETSGFKLKRIAAHGLEAIPKTAPATMVASILAKYKPHGVSTDGLGGEKPDRSKLI
jgi:signal transduction histidine kinase